MIGGAICGFAIAVETGSPFLGFLAAAAGGAALALIVGVVIGTYSSIYVAASSLLMLGISKEDLMVPVKEGAEPGGP